jgi:hypothetical protein
MMIGYNGSSFDLLKKLEEKKKKDFITREKTEE